MSFVLEDLRMLDIRHRTISVSSWMNGWYMPSWIHEELCRRLISPSTRLANRNESRQTNDDYRYECFNLVNKLKACAKSKDLCEGTRLHFAILERGLLPKSPYLASTLVSMYVKCGSLQKAQELLEELPSRDVVCWSALISGYAQQGLGHAALNCFEQMKREGISPDAVIFTSALKACGIIGAIEKGKQIHDEIRSMGLLSKDILLGTALVDMYAKCGNLTKAKIVFDGLLARNVVTWNTLIAGYIQQDQYHETLNCFRQMLSDGLSPNAITFTLILKTCGCLRALNIGERIHEMIVSRGLLEKDILLGNALVDMYAKCGQLTKARETLYKLPAQNITSWSALIAAYVEQEQSHEALNCFQQVLNEGLSPNGAIFMNVLKACGNIGSLETGKHIHEMIMNKHLLEKDSALRSALINFYVKCGELEKAIGLLENLPVQNVIIWDALISAYCQTKQWENVMTCFERMQRLGLSPTAVTFACILKAYAKTGAIDLAKQIHDEIISRGMLENNFVLGTALVNMYAKCGMLVKAQQMLEELPVRDVISWSSLITGYAQHGLYYKALNCFRWMQSEGLIPDEIIFSCILRACSGTRILNEVNWIEDGFVNMVVGENSLININSEPFSSIFPFKNLCVAELIAKYAKLGKCHEVLNCFENMQREGHTPNVVAYIYILEACGRIGAVDKTKQIHYEIVKKGLLNTDIVLGTALIDAYNKCGMVAKAWKLLEELPVRDVVAWSVMITGYTQSGKCQEALNCFELMRIEGISPDSIIFTCILKVCGHLEMLSKGEQIHDEIVYRGLLGMDAMLGTALLDMYAKCGMLEKAEGIMKQLPVQNEVSWTALIAGYAKQEQFHKALECFSCMCSRNFSPNKVTYVCVFKACGIIRAMQMGETIYTKAVCMGLEKDVVLGTALVDMYSKCKFLDKAECVLEQLPVRDVTVWNTMIVGYSQQERYHEALNCIEHMQNEGVSPNIVTFVCILKACGSAGSIEKGEQIHHEILHRRLLEHDVVIGNTLVDMYARCGLLDKAQGVLKGLPVRNVISWCSLIAGYSQMGNGDQALDCFEQMKNEGVSPNVVTFICVLKACASIRDLNKGKQIHKEVASKGLLEKNVSLGNVLLDMYTKCGELAIAKEVFEQLPVRDVVTWSTMISGYAQKGKLCEVMNSFEHMQSEGVRPNTFTFTCILRVCGSVGDIVKGMQLHKEIENNGLLYCENSVELGAALVDMYARCGALAKAEELLAKLSCHDNASFNIIIAMYAEKGQCPQALKCYQWMQKEGLSPDIITLTCILKACGTAGNLEIGSKIHQEIVEKGLLEKDTVVGNVIVDMYVKCGLLERALKVHEVLPVRNTISWCTLIAGYAEHKRGNEALHCFEQMKNEGLFPDAITFLCLLNACAQSGLLDEAQLLFNDMAQSGIAARFDHCICLMMIFGCAGHIEKAISLINFLPSAVRLGAWLVLLDACKKWANVKLGILAFNQAVLLDTSCAAAYVLMASLFASAGMRQDANIVEAMGVKYSYKSEPRNHRFSAVLNDCRLVETSNRYVENIVVPDEIFTNVFQISNIFSNDYKEKCNNNNSSFLSLKHSFLRGSIDHTSTRRLGQQSMCNVLLSVVSM